MPSIKAALSALQTTGGKIICSLSTLPTWGPGKLIMRDKNQAPDGETRLFAIENAEWKALATKLSESGVGIDFFAASPGGGFMDLTTIGGHLISFFFLFIAVVHD
jgi:protein transport protein SEC24